jgi:hypothetical protein
MPGMPPNDGLDPERQETILALLRERSKSASLSALRQQLLQDGYDRATVDRAIAVFQEQPHPPAPRRRFWPWPLLIAAFNSVLTIVLTMLLSRSPSEEPYWIAGPVVLAFLICCGEVFIAFLMLIPRETRPWIGVLLLGIGLFAGVAVVALGGLCAGIMFGPH